MSEQEGVNNTPASPAENLIPKQRLDELIQRERQARAETESLRALVQSLVPKPQAAAPKESARLQKMREEDPEMYAEIKKTQLETQRLRAAMYAQADQLDKDRLVKEIGLEKANAHYHEIERIIDQARKSGNPAMTRYEAYVLIRGQDSLQRERNPAPKVATEAPKETSYSNDAPPSDIEAQGSNLGAARVQTSERNWDDWASKNANQEF